MTTDKTYPHAQSKHDAQPDDHPPQTHAPRNVPATLPSQCTHDDTKRHAYSAQMIAHHTAPIPINLPLSPYPQSDRDKFPSAYPFPARNPTQSPIYNRWFRPVHRLLLWPFVDITDREAMERELQVDQLGWHVVRYMVLVVCVAVGELGVMFMVGWLRG
jgi:hypothetical protein